MAVLLAHTGSTPNASTSGQSRLALDEDPEPLRVWLGSHGRSGTRFVGDWERKNVVVKLLDMFCQQCLAFHLSDMGFAAGCSSGLGLISKVEDMITARHVLHRSAVC